MRPNILLVVEGAVNEPRFFKNFFNLFGLDHYIYELKTNIYTLYSKMKALDFNADLKDVLANIHPEKKDILNKKFAYTYLIFDCDAHHSKKDDNRTIDAIVKENISRLSEMASYFDNETDPSIGKLYINFPMMESYRDCDYFFDDNYKESAVNINEINKYKQIVGNKKLCKIHIDKYTKDNFTSLMLQNLFKLNYINLNKWDKPDFKTYREASDSNSILDIQSKTISEKRLLYVLNTSLFIIIDYFGQRNNFYDNLQHK